MNAHAEPVVGVKSTRIYCRTVCRPSRAPRAENCVPFLDARAARLSGYRACQQCRPEDRDDLPDSKTDAATVVRYGTARTVWGDVLVGETDKGLCALDFIESQDDSPALDRIRRRIPGACVVNDAETAERVVPRILASLIGEVDAREFALDLRGSSFQRRVWEALTQIPRGETTTYGKLAKRLGLPSGAARAVGMACGSNPVSLVVPCHRVISASGRLHGYYWGLEKKKAILAAEGVSIDA